MTLSPLDRALRSLDGLSVGDAFGERFFLPPAVAQGLIAHRALPAPPWRFTDDTEMALAIVDVLGSAGRIDQDLLAQAFARRWSVDRNRGYGAGAHDILHTIALGGDWRDAARAVFNGQGSLGNGGGMRSAPIGAYFAEDLDRVTAEARASAEVTHAHPEGQAGAIAIALAAALAWRGEPRLLDAVYERTPEGATRHGLQQALGMRQTTPEEAAGVLGSGSRVTSADTVPFAIWCAERHLDDFEAALWTTVSGLGDRDTTCAMVGGIVALRSAPPAAWVAAREALRHDPPPRPLLVE